MNKQELKNAFISLYGEGEEIRFFTSPGRVNLLGEHTDYNGGYVFPAALSMGTTIVVRKRGDNIVRMKATDLEDVVEINLDRLEDYKNIKWGNYQAGVLYELKKSGYALTGCDMLYHDTLPHGGGLSSSAAIEVATALSFATFSNEAKGISSPVDMVEMAKIGQAAENNFIGVGCGIMDQFASAMGKKDHALYLKCDTLAYEVVSLPMEGYSLVIANTNKKRSLVDSVYNTRLMECQAALSALREGLPHISNLTDVSEKDFAENMHLIKDPIIRNRAKHVISENARVLKGVRALQNGDIHLFGQMMNASHASLRDLYEVTGTELDTLAHEAQKAEGVIGSRMTGAGFGGCTVTLIKTECVQAFTEKVGKAYTEKIGYAPSFYVSDIEDGGHEIIGI